MDEYSAIRIATYGLFCDRTQLVRHNFSIHKESVVISLSRVDGRVVCTGRGGNDALIHTSNSG